MQKESTHKEGTDEDQLTPQTVEIQDIIIPTVEIKTTESKPETHSVEQKKLRSYPKRNRVPTKYLQDCVKKL